MTAEEVKQEEELFMAVEPIFLAPRRCLVGEEFCGPDLVDTEPLDILGRQVQMILSLLKRGGNLDLLVDLWGIVGEHTQHSNGTTNFDWRPRRVFVSIFVALLTLSYLLFSSLFSLLLHCKS